MSSKLFLVVAPLRFLENHIEQARRKLDGLVSDIGYVEQVVQQDIHDTEILLLITKLRFLQSRARQT